MGDLKLDRHHGLRVARHSLHIHFTQSKFKNALKSNKDIIDIIEFALSYIESWIGCFVNVSS